MTGMIRLIYHSKVSPGLTAADISNIYNVSMEWNKSVGIGGVLFSDGKRFIQMIEGGASIITQLFRKILNDGRHFDVTLAVAEPLAERRFGDWGMGLIRNSDPNVSVLITKMTGSDSFSPETMGLDELRSLLLLLARLGDDSSLKLFKG